MRMCTLSFIVSMIWGLGSVSKKAVETAIGSAWACFRATDYTETIQMTIESHPLHVIEKILARKALGTRECVRFYLI